MPEAPNECRLVGTLSASVKFSSRTRTPGDAGRVAPGGERFKQCRKGDLALAMHGIVGIDVLERPVAENGDGRSTENDRHLPAGGGTDQADELGELAEVRAQALVDDVVDVAH